MLWRNRRAVAVATMALTLLLMACSDRPHLARNFDESPEVLPSEPVLLASGTTVDSDNPATTIEWNLEGIVGFSHAVSLRAETSSSTRVSSASRQGADDQLWVVGATLTHEGPSMVFGGADEGVEALVLINDEGDEFAVELMDVPGVDWQVAVEQLPDDWIDKDAPSRVEIVAIQDGAEVAREELLGFHR